MTTYTIQTNLPPEAVTRIGLEIFKLWVDFAMGRAAIGSRSLIYPTGRYAASISFRQEGIATAAIMSDEAIAPEAAILETGHGRIDLKAKLQRGRAYPMHRARGGTAGTSLRRVGNPAPAALKPRATTRGGIVQGVRHGSVRASMWAEMRSATSSGFASIGPNSPPDSWIIPPMPAYAPAANLARMAEQMAQS